MTFMVATHKKGKKTFVSYVTYLIAITPHYQ